MKLRGIDFGHVLDASGARGWFGEGHLFHPFIPGLNFEGSTFVAKTTTLNPNRGNANMRRDGLTARVFPQRAVKVNLREAAVMNRIVAQHAIVVESYDPAAQAPAKRPAARRRRAG